MNNPTAIGNVHGITESNRNSGVGAYVSGQNGKTRCNPNTNSPFVTFNPCKKSGKK